MPHRLFISFAPEDRSFRDVLVKHLAPLKKSGKLAIEDETTVPVGAPERDTRLAFLERAHVIVLLLSRDYFHRDETSDHDLPAAFERNKTARVPMMPVRVSECEIKDTLLEGRKILPEDGQPIGSPSNDKLLTEVVKALRAVLEGLPPPADDAPIPVRNLPLLLAADDAEKDDEAKEKDHRRLRGRLMEVFGTAPARFAGELEAVFLKSAAFQDVVRWRERMAAVERCVCRIKVQYGGSGTGFLVSPRHVMTNAHVAWMLGESSGAFQFDAKVDASGSMKVRGVAFAAMEPAIFSEPQELDYALFELPEAIGGEPAAPGEAPRGWLALSERTIAEREPLFILQHPEGDALKLCVGAAVKGNRPQPRRVFYEANTLQGSSGSPVFDMGWEVVALHHAGDEDAGANRGIPARLIIDDLRSRNALHLLGAPPSAR